jgi:hypothetical protein
MNDLVLWNKFCETYDTNILNNLSTNGHKILQNFIKKDNVKFEGLQRIIQNYYKLRDDMYYADLSIGIENNTKYNTLSHIYSISEHYSEKYDKHIYIFGEFHDYHGSCSNNIPASRFVLEQMAISDKFIDLYFEWQFIPRSQGFVHKRFGSHQLSILYASLYGHMDLFIEKWSNNGYANVRPHLTDVRRVYNKYDFINVLNSLLVTMAYGDKSYDLLTEFENLSKFPTDLYEFKKIKTIEDLKTFIFSRIPLVNKEVKRMDEDVKNSVLDHFNTCIDNIDVTKFYYDNIKRVLRSSSNTTNYGTYLLAPFICIMDLYLLARIFKHFNKVPYHNSNPPKNIIIYVGNLHAETYRRYLDVLGFETKFYNMSQTHCVDISRLKLPLFSM